MNKYLVLQKKTLKAKSDIIRRKFGYELYDEEEGVYYCPYTTKEVFQVIEHPKTDFVAIVIPENIPFGMKGGEDWTRGKDREVNGGIVKGKPQRDEAIDKVWISNKPLKDHQYMVDNGWFNEEN